MPLKQGKTSQHHNWPHCMDWQTTKKARNSSACRTPKILGKQGKNAQNHKEFLEKEKCKENQKGKEKKITDVNRGGSQIGKFPLFRRGRFLISEVSKRGWHSGPGLFLCPFSYATLRRRDHNSGDHFHCVLAPVRRQPPPPSETKKNHRSIRTSHVGQTPRGPGDRKNSFSLERMKKKPLRYLQR